LHYIASKDPIQLAKMLETAGTKLRRMRILRQLSLEDVARGTRISVARLADLETDEYSNFPNIAYAKGFLRSYAKFLNLDLRTYLDAFEDTSTFGLDDYQYLSEKPVGVYRIPRRPQQRPRFRRSRMLATASVVGVFAIVVMVWFLYKTAQRLGDLNKLAERQEAREHGGGTRPGAESPAARQMQPVSSSPTPTVSPSPEGTPTSSDSMGRELVALTLAESSPSAVLTQLSAPAANVPLLPTADTDGTARILALRSMMQKPFLLGSPSSPVNNVVGGGSSVGAPRATGMLTQGIDAGGSRFYVHMLDKNSVDIFRTGVPLPPKPVGNTLD
jgi:cytoskeletal protein RodZ